MNNKEKHFSELTAYFKNLVYITGALLSIFLGVITYITNNKVEEYKKTYKEEIEKATKIVTDSTYKQMNERVKVSIGEYLITDKSIIYPRIDSVTKVIVKEFYSNVNYKIEIDDELLEKKIKQYLDNNLNTIVNSNSLVKEATKDSKLFFEMTANRIVNEKIDQKQINDVINKITQDQFLAFSKSLTLFINIISDIHLATSSDWDDLLNDKSDYSSAFQRKIKEIYKNNIDQRIKDQIIKDINEGVFITIENGIDKNLKRSLTNGKDAISKDIVLKYLENPENTNLYNRALMYRYLIENKGVKDYFEPIQY